MTSRASFLDGPAPELTRERRTGDPELSTRKSMGSCPQAGTPSALDPPPPAFCPRTMTTPQVSAVTLSTASRWGAIGRGGPWRNYKAARFVDLMRSFTDQDVNVVIRAKIGPATPSLISVRLLLQTAPSE